MSALETADFIHRKTWTRTQAAKLVEIFPGERYELIEGDLINKMGQSPPHAYIIALLTSIFAEAFPGRVRIQSSITLPEPEGIRSEPEPDVVVLHRHSAAFFHRHPGPEDIALLIEVSDSTLQMDREIKSRLYARSGVAVYWIIDIQQRRIMTFGNPGADEYKSVVIYEGDETVSFKPFSLVISASQLFDC